MDGEGGLWRWFDGGTVVLWSFRLIEREKLISLAICVYGGGVCMGFSTVELKKKNLIFIYFQLESDLNFAQ